MEKQKKHLEYDETFNNTSKSNGGWRQSQSVPHEMTEDLEEEEDVEAVAETKEQRGKEKTDLANIVDSVFGQVRMHNVCMYTYRYTDNLHPF